jgi:hypothetical protein
MVISATKPWMIFSVMTSENFLKKETVAYWKTTAACAGFGESVMEDVPWMLI